MEYLSKQYATGTLKRAYKRLIETDQNEHSFIDHLSSIRIWLISDNDLTNDFKSRASVALDNLKKSDGYFYAFMISKKGLECRTIKGLNINGWVGLKQHLTIDWK